MKKIYLLLAIISIFIMSCSGHFFNPKYYYGSSSSSSEGNTGGGSGPGEDIDTGEPENPDEDPFIKGDWNKPYYNGFDGNQIKDWFPRISFDGQNVPIYEFKIESRQWNTGNPTLSEYYFDASGDGNTAQGIAIKPMTIYKYEFKNPLIDPNGKYNSSDRMKRFLFYRIVGESKVLGIGADLDQYLIAVDIYSKLVFAYAKIVGTYDVMGNDVPNDFEAAEYHGERRNFYEYDPIGIVHSDGRVTLYEEYKNEMRQSATKFFPQVHNPDRAMASYDGPGTSPYFNKNSDLNKKEMKLTFTSLELRNIDSRSANRNAITGNVGIFGSVFDYALFGYDMKLDFYLSSSDLHSLASFATINPSKIADALKIGVSSSGNIKMDKSEHLLLYKDGEEKDIMIDMSVNLTKYDERAGDFLKEVHYPYAYSEQDKIKIKLKYNSDVKNFTLVSITDDYGNRIKSKTESLTVNENSEAEISMTIDGMDGDDNRDNCGNGPTGLNNQVELKIKFKFENIK